MSRVAFFHVGMPKCASTTLQALLSQNRARLAQEGLHYPVAPRGDGEAPCGNHLISRRKDPKRFRALLEQFLDTDCPNVVISGEMLITINRSRLRDEIVEICRARGFELRLLTLFKRQDLWIESDFKQQIKGGTMFAEPLEALMAHRERHQTLDYHFQMALWAKAVARDRMTVLGLNPAQPRDYAVERFCAWLGIDPAILSYTGQDRNVSPSAPDIEAARLLKAELIARGVEQPDLQRLLGEFLAALPPVARSQRQKALLSPERRAELLERYAESNRLLAQEFNGGVALFEGEVPEAETRFRPVAPQAQARLAGAHAEALLAGKTPGGPGLGPRDGARRALVRVRDRIWQRIGR